MHNAPANIISPWKRALSTFVALALAATMCPASALADEVADKEASAPVEAVSGDRALVAASSSAATASAAPEASAEPFAPENPDEPEGAPKIISQTQQVAASPESADDEASAGEVIYRSGIGYALDEEERTAAIADVTAAAGAELFIPRAIECDGDTFEVASVLPGAIAADSSIVGFKADEESRFAAQDAALYAIDADDEGELYATLIWHAPASGEAFVVPESIEHDDEDIPVRAIGQAAFRSSADLKSIITRADIERIARAEEADSAPSEGKLPSEQAAASAPVAAFTEEALEDIVVTLIDGADDAAWQEAGFAHIERISLPEPEQGDEPATPEEPEQPDVPAAPEAPAAEGALAYTLRPDCTLEASWEGPAPRAGTIVVPAAAELAGTLYPVTAIAKGAFADAKWLTGIELASSVTRIEEGAFAGCTGLTSVKLSEGLRVIDYAAFEGATALKHLVIPSTLVALGGSALAGCSSLATMVFLPVSATIGEGAFAGTTDLTIYSCGGIGAQAPASSIAVHPVGVTLATDPLQLKVGESAAIFEGGALEDAGIGKCSYAYGAAICAVDADGNVTATAPGTEQVIVELSIMGTPVAKAARAVSVKAVASPMIAADADLSSLDPEERERAEQGANAGVSSELLGSFVRQASGRTMSLVNVPVALSSDEMPLTTIDPATMSMETDHIIYAALYGEPDSGSYTLWIGTSREGDSTLGKLAYGIWSGVGQSTAADNAPWSKYAASITNVVIEDNPAKPVKPKSTAYWFSGLANVSSFGSQLAHIGTSDVLSMSFMFYQCGAVTSLDLSSFDMSSVADMSYMFRSCTSLTSVGFSSTGTPKLENMAHMFRGCGKLTSLDLSKFTTARVTQMNELFRSCSKLAALDISSFDTSSVTNMYYLFFGCSALSALDLRHFDTSQVTNMAGMFSGCSGLASLDVSGFKTGNVADMGSMFNGCTGLAALDVSGFDTGNVTSMYEMFNDCASLTVLDVSGFDMGKVMEISRMFRNVNKAETFDVSNWNTSSIQSMNGTFLHCNALKTLDVSRWDTSNCTNMGNLFGYTTNLRSLDLSNWDTSKVISFAVMFQQSGIETLDLSGFDTSSAQSMSQMFLYMSYLEVLDVSGWDVSNVTDFQGMFDRVWALKSLDISGWSDARADANKNAMFRILGGRPASAQQTIKISPNFRFPEGANSDDTGAFQACLWYMNGQPKADGSVYSNTDIVAMYNNPTSALPRPTEDVTWTTVKSAETASVTFTLANYGSATNAIFVNGDPGNNKLLTKTAPVGTAIAAPGAGDVIYTGIVLRGWTTRSPGRVIGRDEPLGADDVAAGAAVTISADMAKYFPIWSSDLESAIKLAMNDGTDSLAGTLEVRSNRGIWIPVPGGSAGQRQEAAAGDEVIVANGGAIPSRAGWVFSGYYDTPAPETDADGNVTANGIMMITSAGTLTTTGADFASTPAAMRDATWYARWAPANEDLGIKAALYGAAPDYTLWIGTGTEPVTVSGKAKAYGPFLHVGQSTASADDNSPWNTYAKDIKSAQIGAGTRPTSTIYWFNGMQDLTQIEGLANLDTSQVTDMAHMFSYTGLTTLDLSTFDTHNVTNMGFMFGHSNNLTSIDMSSFDTSNVTEMTNMFNYVSSVKELDLSSFDTSNVTHMVNMFLNCKSVERLDLSSFDTSNVQSMASMFSWCDKLVSVDVSSFDTSNVTSMTYMFGGDPSLTEIKGLEGFDTSNVTNMGYMFSTCRKLTSLTLGNFNTSKVTNMVAMFDGCSALTNLDLSSFDTTNVTNMGWMFRNCTSLKALDISQFDFTNLLAPAGGGFAPYAGLRGFLNASTALEIIDMSHCKGIPESLYAADYECVLAAFNIWAANDQSITFRISKDFRFPKGATGQNTGALPATVSWYLNGSSSKAYKPAEIVAYHESGASPTDVVTWTTKTVANSYTATFSAGAGSFADSTKASVTVPAGTSIVAPGVADVSRAGYMLKEWKRTSGTTTVPATVLPGGAITVNDNATYDAVWVQSAANTITLSSNGGSGSAGPLYVRPEAGVMASATGSTYLVAGAQAVPAAKLPIREGYTFAGYYAATADGQQFSTMYVTSAGTLTSAGASYANSQAAKRDSTWYARWMPASEDLGIKAAVYGAAPDYILWIGTGAEPATVSGKTKAYGPFLHVGQSTGSTEESAPWLPYAVDITSVRIDPIAPTSMVAWFMGMTNLSSLDVSNIDTKNVESMAELFHHAEAIRTIDLSSWTITSKLTDMGRMFYYANSLTNITWPNADKMDTSQVVTMRAMFMNVGRYSGTTLDLNLSCLDTSSVQNFSSMFHNTFAVTSLDVSGFNTSSAVNMNSMFLNCYAALDVSGFDTSNVVDMGSMFNGARGNFTTIDVSSFNTSNVTNMTSMFDNCQNLVEIKGLESFDTGKVTSMRRMFFACGVQRLDLSGFDTSSVTDMYQMFHFASNLTELDVSGWDTSNVTTMFSMFRGVPVSHLDLSSFDVSNVWDFYAIFRDCEELISIDLSGWNFRSAVSVGEMFRDTGKLKHIDMSGWESVSPSNWARLFYNSGDVDLAASPVAITLSKEFRFPADATNTTTGAFQNWNWYKNGEGSAMSAVQVCDFYASGQATADITWTTQAAAAKHTITFDLSNGGTFTNGFSGRYENVLHNTTFSLPGATVVTPPVGKVLAGWSTKQDQQADLANKPGVHALADRDYTYFAIWADGPVYKRTFDFNGGTIGESGRDALWVRPGVGVYRTQAAEQPFAKRDFVLRADGVTSPLASAFPTRAGYRFAGFNNPEGTQVINSEGLLTDWDAAVAKSRNTVWTAQWDAERYTVRFELTFPEGEDSSSMSGTQPADIRTDGSQSVAMPGIGDIKSEGYFLSGWSLSQDGADAFDCDAEVAVSDLIASGAAPDADGVITLYSAWTPRLSGTVPARVTLAVERMATTSVTTPVAATIQNTSGAPISVVSLEAVDQGAANAFDGATASELAAITLTLQPAGGDPIAVSLGQTAQPEQGQSALFSIGRKANLGVTYGMESLSAALCEKIKDKYSGQLANLTFTVQLEASN